MMHCMPLNKIFLVGSSTFALTTLSGESVADMIGRLTAQNSESFTKNALQVIDIPEQVICRMLQAEVLILHIGVMEFLPRLEKRIYPHLHVQSKNGFFYDIRFEPFPPLAWLLNIHNRVCFNVQLSMKLFRGKMDPNSLKNFVSRLTQESTSQFSRIIFISSPPVNHPKSREARIMTQSALAEIVDIFDYVSIIDYTEMTYGLNHDKSGHLVPDHREQFATRVAAAIQESER